MDMARLTSADVRKKLAEEVWEAWKITFKPHHSPNKKQGPNIFLSAGLVGK
jgi:hypothetical protein